jgi:hypothetical protein
MSSEKRENMELSKEYLGAAERSLQTATEFAKKGGDKQVIEKITKVKEATKEIKQEIHKKLNENG